MGGGKGQGRADFQDIGVERRGRNQHPPPPHFVDQGQGQGAVGVPGRAVAHHLDAHIQAGAAHVADPVVLLHQVAQARLHDLAHLMHVVLQVFPLHDLKRRPRCGHGHRVAAKRVEISHVMAEILGHLGLHGDIGHRLAIAHGLAHRHDVGHHAVPLIPPHMRAGAGKAALHLVGEEDTAGLMDNIKNRLQHAGIVRENSI